MSDEKQLPAIASKESLLLIPVMDSRTALQRLDEFQGFIKDYLKEGLDYGVIPGTEKPTLLQPGAEKLCEIFGFYPDYEMMQRVEKWELEPPLFDYEIKCTLKSKRDHSIVAAGIGSCNSYEAKYKWRMAEPKCPDCGKEGTIKKSKFPDKQTGLMGWYCYNKAGGCGANWGYPDEPAIVSQERGKVGNPDMASQKNTVLQMAQKRAYIKATRSATRSSQFFTQDIEDFPPFSGESMATAEVKDITPKPPQYTEQEIAEAKKAADKAAQESIKPGAKSAPSPARSAASTSTKADSTAAQTTGSASLTEEIANAQEVEYSDGVASDPAQIREAIAQTAEQFGYLREDIGVVAKFHFGLTAQNRDTRIIEIAGDLATWFKTHPNPTPGKQAKLDKVTGLPTAPEAVTA